MDRKDALHGISESEKPSNQEANGSVEQSSNFPTPRTDPAHCKKTSLNVLLVDDHPANLMILEQQLIFLGHTTQSAENGAQALMLTSQTKFDLIITDCRMPVMDGFELTKQLRAQEKILAQSLYWIIGVTASTDDDERDLCIQAGMEDCLFKPVGARELEHCIKNLQGLVNQSQSREPKHISQLVDDKSIHALTNGDDDLKALFLQQLHTTNQVDLDKLHGNLKLLDWEGFSFMAHRVKGVARLINAKSLVESIEKYEKAMNLENKPSNIESIATEVCCAIEDLQRSLEIEIGASQS